MRKQEWAKPGDLTHFRRRRDFTAPTTFDTRILKLSFFFNQKVIHSQAEPFG
jgi:hypothetical protein